MRPARILWVAVCGGVLLAALVILEYLLLFDDLFTQRVTGQLNHFSNYAIAR